MGALVADDRDDVWRVTKTLASLTVERDLAADARR